MTRQESDEMFMAELHTIVARKKAGLDPTEAFVQGLLAIIERYRREVALAKEIEA